MLMNTAPLKYETMKNYLLLLALPILLSARGQNDADPEVEIVTTHGTIVVRLYDETPLHRDNFLQLVDANAYDSILFHRVIDGFMIQAGDPDSRRSQPGVKVGENNIGDNIDAEIVPGIFHKKGALAAARKGDRVNPERKSSGSQFYIVQGVVYTPEELDARVEKVNKGRKEQERVVLTAEQVEAYTTVGGTPHLDGAYTVFGEVVEGLDIVDKIAAVETDMNARPREDVRIIRMARRK